MKLYYMPGACSLATHITLEWIGASYETQQVPRDELHQPAYLKVNPAGSVPALQVDGVVLTQNDAVLNYLADTHPEARLSGGDTPAGRAEVNRWLGMVNSDIHGAYRQIFRADSFLSDKAAIAEAKDDARATLKRFYAIVDQQLQGRDWIAGDRSIADPYLFAVTNWAAMVGPDLSEFGNLGRFMQHMQADAGVQKAMHAEGLI